MRTERLHTADGDVVVIEYHERDDGAWVPHSIVTTDATWDAVWSKASSAVLVHMSGGGTHTRHHVGEYMHTQPPPCRIWMAEGIVAERWVGENQPLRPVTDSELLTMGYERIADPLGDPFEGVIHLDGHMQCCSICDDWIDANMCCDHLGWCDDLGVLIGSGSDADHDAIAESIASLVAKVGPDAVRACLSLSVMPSWYDDPLCDARDDDECEAAIVWLGTLGQGEVFDEARALTETWIQTAMVET